ncbi:MAG: threonine/serine exporter [Clostridiales bacterium]|nr:threonine/serine exporter [Clostridiales bacterium]
MDNVVRALACMAAACFFGMILRQPKSTLIYTAVIGLVGYVIFILMKGTLLAFFVSGLVVGILCELSARIAKKATTLFLISSIIPTVPGLGLYRSMMALSENNLELSLQIGVETLAGIGAIALALTIATAIFSCIRPLRLQRLKH